jgi:hypothetical protein
MTFDELVFEPHPYAPRGKIAKHTFPNGYSVSVLRSPGSYGYDMGRYELAVHYGGGISYDNPVTGNMTDGIRGWLTEDDVTKYLKEVEALSS